LIKAVKKDLIEKNKSENKSMVSSQNEDTGIPSYSPKDCAKPFERKNISRGCREPVQRQAAK
jgi:hypothetical protein